MTTHQGCAEEATTSRRPFRVGDIVRLDRTGQLGRVTGLGPGSLLSIELPHGPTGRRSTHVPRSAVRHAGEDGIFLWFMRQLDA